MMCELIASIFIITNTASHLEKCEEVRNHKII